jgi:hypothetical protein
VAALPSIPKTIKCTFHTTITGGPTCLTRFFMQYTGAAGSVDVTTLCGTMAASWATRLAPNTGSDYQLSATQIEDMDSKTGVNVIVPTSHAGTATQTGITAGAAFIMSAHVAFRYRGGHSRVYIPGITTQDLADKNSWTVGSQGTISTAWTGILSDLATSPPIAVGTLSQIAVHAYSSNVQDFGGQPPSTHKPPWPLPVPVKYAISSWSANPQVGSQRRRNQQ